MVHACLQFAAAFICRPTHGMVTCMVLKDELNPLIDISSLAINFSTKYFSEVERVLTSFRNESKAFSNVVFCL
jgi:hypothetical protein